MGDSTRRGRIRYGTLENEVVAYAKRKREEEDDDDAMTSTAVDSLIDIPEAAAAVRPGANIDLDQIDEILDESQDQQLNDEALETRRRAMAEFDRKRIARTIAVPTNDMQVKEALRKYGHPICLFGEDAGDRRDRLRYILSKQAIERRNAGQEDISTKEDDMENEVSSDEEKEEFYTEGSDMLLQARQNIARKSLLHARQRVEQQQKDCQVDLATIRQLRENLVDQLRKYTIVGSQVGDSRPLSRIAFSPDSSQVLVGSWTGSIKLWDIPGCQMAQLYRGHTDRVGGLSFHPQAGQGDSRVDFASGASDNEIFLWSLGKDTPIGQLKGHQSRVVHVEHHPSGDYLGSASYDGSWRLWDIASEKELLLQEGHSREVFALRFQCDGSLVATAGLDGIGRVWDLRSGRSIMELEGHAKEIFGLDWSPNGYQLATGSADNTMHIFDLRKIASIHQIPAHKSMVTDVRYFHFGGNSKAQTSCDMDMDVSGDQSVGDHEQARLCSGQYLASASNDGLINIWTAGDWKLQKSLAGHVGKVLSVDIARDGSYIASTGFDKTFKLWKADDILQL
ncbi:hypothetical protein LPJ68_001321 [Coemansia sp. RSA 1086]|nr:hypothetical protein LPJ68_001321 [Coemansia sp. RSA 1086]